jgi:glycosyltransferase involved in cell wall biosynthesis
MRRVRLGSKSMTRLRLRGLLHDADLVIAEQALRHVETYELFARQAAGSTRVALWGHGRTMVRPVRPPARWALGQLTRRAHWFFAYTERGREEVVGAGFPADRVTVVQNAIDTEELAEALGAVDDDDVESLRTDLGLPDRGVCLSVGTLLPERRLNFLLEAAQLLSGRLPEFALVVAGDGPERAAVEEAARRYPWLRYVGRADTRMKALLARVSDVMLAPGRVGLVAVDSFALRTPIVTTDWPFHGPEFKYLVDGLNSVVTCDSPGAFAHEVERVLQSPDLVRRMARQCDADARRYTLAAMVDRFASGVVEALDAPPR